MFTSCVPESLNLGRQECAMNQYIDLFTVNNCFMVSYLCSQVWERNLHSNSNMWLSQVENVHYFDLNWLN